MRNRFSCRLPRRRSRSAFGLIETVLAAFLFSLVLLGGVSLVSTSATLFQGTAQSAYAEGDLDRSLRQIRAELSFAYDFSVDSGGQGITYYRYQTDATGAVVRDAQGKPVPDGTAHRFYLRQNGTRPSGKPSYDLIWSDQFNATTKPLCKFISDKDSSPEATGATTYPLFASLTANTVQVRLIAAPVYGAGSGWRTTTQRTMTYIRCRNR